MDVASNDVFQGVRRLDVVEIGRRRRWSDEAKEQIVGEAYASNRFWFHTLLARLTV